MCIGGPALVIYVSPTDEELFKVCTWNPFHFLMFLPRILFFGDNVVNIHRPATW